MSRVARLHLPIEDWPVLDRQAWHRATSPATSLFSPEAAAAELSPRTIGLRKQAMATWFSYLQRWGALPPRSAVGLVTPKRLDGYVEEQLARGLCNSTIRIRLQSLQGGLRLMAPEQDFGFICRPGGRSLRKRLPSVPREVPLRATTDLLTLSWTLFERGRAGLGYGGGIPAIRDAALIGILATRAPRCRSIAEMELGRQIRKENGVYWLRFEEENMKGGERLGYQVAEFLTPVFDHYINVVRPLFGGDHTRQFWVGLRRQAITARGITKIVQRRTHEAFGRAYGPHWFRRCLTTDTGLKSPELMLDVCQMMDHSPTISAQHYNKAKAVGATARHGKLIAGIMEDTRGLAERTFAKRKPKLSANRRTPPHPF